MIIDKNYELKKNGKGIDLIYKYIGQDKKGNDTGRKSTYHYGTVYQGLQGYLDKRLENSVDLLTVTEIDMEISKALLTIQHCKDIIKKEFCIEVRIEG